ncbi:GreA/GreB family elongation factor [Pelagibacterium lentulum]|uniref:Transcription elongation factor GreA/GreB C-terminal domain-containing protein n=1 Tax=Pelagibacterium lentulum TaxID=2029865 RepID=A0A916RBP9_9HYPH|nr:GreA/GreB family elongation factor [Pelagibacterium lentulum]GGA42992.1 hypothetical protein GCM10011499_10680 [Pelagibacterium lentulum]
MRYLNNELPAVLKFGSRDQTGMMPFWSHLMNRILLEGGILMCMSRRPSVTPRDFSILETMLADHLGGDELLIAAIRKKLDDAQIVFADDLPAEVVTIGSRVAFTVDDQWSQERRLVPIEHYVPGQDHQSVASLRGIGLLGQAAGDKIEIDFGGRVVALEIHKVLYQPEAESKARKTTGNLHLVASHSGSPQPAFRRSVPKPGDDPGPSAA